MRSNGTSNSPRIGLACAGGVVEGAIYEVGALRALDEAVDGASLHELDMYVGVSSGALIGSFLANGVPTHELTRAIVSAASDPSLNVEPEVLFRPALSEYAGRIKKLPGALLNTLKHYACNPGDLSLLGLVSTLGSLVPTGIFDNSGLGEFLERAFSEGGRTNDFRELRAKLFVVTMHLDSARIAVFGEPGLDHVPISKAIQASTALPGLYCPVEIDGQYYIDGVARRTVHASVALDAGAELLFCINPIVPVNVQLEQHADRLLKRDGSTLVDHGLPSVLSQTFRAIVDSRKQTGFKKYEHTHPDADLILIEPECDDTSLFFSNIFSFQNRHDVCEHAYQATRQHLLRRADEIAAKLERHGLRLNVERLEDESRSVFDPEPGALPSGSLNGDANSPKEVFRETGRVLDRLDAMIDQIQAAA
ncbi:patatin [Longibacter salinarum]|uniref:Patatin n=1 Tax=Longibacter salinarum TaxID=1850348 RepID=A0A2A8CUY2_9BACT|nr:patatin-like phospholipase family protein [Longibacter salinarum]PEN12264.1 patatin [Longibacter salinarum]